MGKVHGSLARAGKVKSQTPKVRFTVTPRRKKVDSWDERTLDESRKDGAIAEHHSGME
jgi:small subunit ribosomal protein S30e